jgi:hypothetical protein
VDPYFHPYLRSRSASQLKDNFGVHLLVPDEIDSPDVFLVYEGPSAATAEYQPPKQRPSAEELADFEKGLQEAQEYLLNILGDQQNVLAKSINVPAKYVNPL